MTNARLCKLFTVFFSVLFGAASLAQAADSVVSDWNLNDVSYQTRSLTTDYSGTGPSYRRSSDHPSYAATVRRPSAERQDG